MYMKSFVFNIYQFITIILLIMRLRICTTSNISGGVNQSDFLKYFQ